MGTHVRVPPSGFNTSTLVVTSKVRHLGVSWAPTRRASLGTPPTASPAETASPCFRNVLRFIALPFPEDRIFGWLASYLLGSLCQLGQAANRGLAISLPSRTPRLHPDGFRPFSPSANA